MNIVRRGRGTSFPRLLTFATCIGIGTVMLAAASPAGAATTSAQQIAAAQKIVAQAQVAPKEIPLKTSLPSKPPKGKTIVFLECDNPQCAFVATTTKEATDAIGWTLKTIPYQSAEPATLVAAFNQALQDNPVAVTLAAAPEVTWSSVIPAYQKAGVIIIPQFVGPATVNHTVVANLASDSDLAPGFAPLAAAVTANSKDKGHVLLVGIPSFAAVLAQANSFTQDLHKLCAGCKLTTLNLSLAQIAGGAAVPAIVSALQADPTIKYVALTDAGYLAVGLPAAIKAAGITGVQISGAAPSALDEQNLMNGTESYLAGVATAYTDWLAVDVAVRHVMGLPFTSNDGGIPHQLLTKKSFVGTPSPSLETPANWQSQFKSLWKVG